MGPDFVFVGPSKSGSTWIFELLRSHPQIYVPVAKDIYFFDRYYEKGLRWYEGFFSGAKPGQVCGELSHDYLSNPTALQRLVSAYPSIKVICCLRNPYERAISSYRFILRNGLVQDGLQDAIEKHPEIRDEGFYGKHLSTLFSLTDRNRVLVLEFDELEKDPDAIAQKIFEFIGVDADFRSSIIGQKINAASSPRSRAAARFVKYSALLLRNWGFTSLVGAVKRNPLVRWVLYRELRKSDQNSAFEAFPTELIDAYERDLTLLSELLGRNYDSWRRPRNLV